MAPVEKAQFVSVIIGGILILVAEVWFIVAGFQVSILWGLYMLFFGGVRSILSVLALLAWLAATLWVYGQGSAVLTTHAALLGGVFVGAVLLNFLGVLFILRHWTEARSPFWLTIAAVVFVGAAVVCESLK